MTLFVTLLLLLLLQFTAVTEQTSSSVTVRAGDEVTLPCNKQIKHQDKCNGTVWIYSSPGKITMELIKLGKINNDVNTKDKSNRLGLTANCSLVITNVTAEDVGHYACRQYNKAGQQQGPGASVDLSVINMEEHKIDDDTFYLSCAVLTYNGCGHTVEWLYEGNKTDVETSQSSCSAFVTFKTPLHQKSKYYESLKCKVTDSRNTLLYEACTLSSCEETGSTTVERNNTPSADNGAPTPPGWWRFIILGLATLVIIVVAVCVWKRTKGNKTQTDVNAVHHEDEDEGTVTYENVGEPSASVRLH